MSVSVILVTLFIVALFLVCWKRLQQYSALDNIPGPSSLELIKVMSNASRKDIYYHFLDLPKKYGPIVRLWVKPLRPAVLVTDPKFFEQILMKREHVQRTDAYRLFVPIAGVSLVTNLNVDLWKKDRKTLAPCFNLKSIAQYPLVYEEQLTTLVKKIKSNQGEPLDVQELMHWYALGVIVELLTGESISSNMEGARTYFTSIKVFFSVYLERVFSSFKMNDFLFKFCKSYNTYIGAGKMAHDYVENLVKIQIAKRKTNDLVEKKDFLAFLLGSGLEYEKIISHVKTFIVAGSDTVAQVMSFALYEIAKHPDVQQKIYDEYKAVVGKENCTANYEDIQKMRYTETVAKETMRLYPPVPILQRRLTTSVSIDGTVIPSDTDIYFAILGTHTSPSLYENPEKFDPDRFSAENISKIQPGSYAPFSLGPRDCIAQKIAMVQVKFTLSHIVGRFELLPVVPEYKLDLVGDMILTSLNGIPVIFKERSL